MTDRKSKFSANNRDGKEMKLYIEGGACEGLKPMEVLQKFPQFQKYEVNSFRQAYNRLKTAFKKRIKERSNTSCEFAITNALDSCEHSCIMHVCYFINL